MKKILFAIALLFSVNFTPVFVSAAPNLGLDLTSKIATQSGYDAATDTTLAQTVGKIIKALLSTLGLIFLVLMVYAGFLYLTSAGDSEKKKKSTDIITAAVIGLIIVLSAYAITTFVLTKLGGVSGGSSGSSSSVSCSSIKTDASCITTSGCAWNAGTGTCEAKLSESDFVNSGNVSCAGRCLTIDEAQNMGAELIPEGNSACGSGFVCVKGGMQGPPSPDECSSAANEVQCDTKKAVGLKCIWNALNDSCEKNINNGGNTVLCEDKVGQACAVAMEVDTTWKNKGYVRASGETTVCTNNKVCVVKISEMCPGLSQSECSSSSVCDWVNNKCEALQDLQAANNVNNDFCISLNKSNCDARKNDCSWDVDFNQCQPKSM